MLQGICAQLVRDAGAHTILLYGSRADGSENEFSDYDVAAFANVARSTRDARIVEGAFLDVFLHPEEVLRNPTAEHLTLRGSVILMQRDAEATDFLGALEVIFRNGPEPLPADEIEARRTWARKMALRMRRCDIEGNFRRAWLLAVLLEDYFSLRGMWYQGPKKSFQWLLNQDLGTYRGFEEALRPGASSEAIDRLVERVVATAVDSDGRVSGV